MVDAISIVVSLAQGALVPSGCCVGIGCQEHIHVVLGGPDDNDVYYFRRQTLFTSSSKENDSSKRKQIQAGIDNLLDNSLTVTLCTFLL